MSPIRIPTRHKSALLLLALVAACHAQAQAPVHDGHAAQARAAARAADDKDSYALVRRDGKGLSASGEVRDWSALQRAGKRIDGEFLWVRQDGKSWVIQDPALLARARAAWEPVERLGRQMDVYGKEMDRHGKAMDALDKEMEQAAAGIHPDEERMRAAQARIDAIGREMGEVGRRMAGADGAEQARLQARMAELQRDMDVQARALDAAARPASQRAAEHSMHRVGLRMDQAHKPMDELGRKMDVLGKQMAQEGRRADTVMRDLVREAMAKGLAHPAPKG